jgi:uracil-DNA glycosylase
LPNSHSRIGWTQFTDSVIKLLSDKRFFHTHTKQPNLLNLDIVFLLWGGFAHAKEKLIDQTKHTVIKTAHPSPLSFNKFSNCKCFSLVNTALQKYDEQPIDWSL